MPLKFYSDVKKDDLLFLEWKDKMLIYFTINRDMDDDNMLLMFEGNIIGLAYERLKAYKRLR